MAPKKKDNSRIIKIVGLLVVFFGTVYFIYNYLSSGSFDLTPSAAIDPGKDGNSCPKNECRKDYCRGGYLYECRLRTIKYGKNICSYKTLYQTVKKCSY